MKYCLQCGQQHEASACTLNPGKFPNPLVEAAHRQGFFEGRQGIAESERYLDEIRCLRKLLADANRGAERNALINRKLAASNMDLREENESLRCLCEELESRLADTAGALSDMIALWERVHEKDGPVLLGRPTLSLARKALDAEAKEEV